MAGAGAGVRGACRIPVPVRAFLPAILATVIAGSGCAVAAPPDWDAIRATIRSEHPDVASLTTSELADSRARGAPVTLIDARAREEYAVSRLEGARSIPFDVRGEALREGLSDLGRDASIVVYCSVGVRSARLASRLRAAGYTNVRNLEGSIFAWANEGRPVVRDGTVVSEVHPYDERWGALLDARLHAREPGGRAAAPRGDRE